MKFSYNWLKQLVDFKQTPEELAHLINTHITEVEEIEVEGSNKYTGVIVAEVLEINSHPNANKLKLVTLDIGLGRKIQVVCGASNVEINQKIAFAPVGAMLPGGKMEAATIRGTESLGMICSESELDGLSKQSNGILVLDKNASVGRPVQEYLNTSTEKILDLKILSNRPDYLSYVGIAREIATVLDKDWANPLDFNYPKDTALDTATKIKLKVDKKLCPKYIAHYVENIEVRESPEWLQEKLLQSGLRPINNIVDISNLVMLELGQPIHAFAYDKVAGSEIQVRKVGEGETIQTLDGETRKLNTDVLVIADSEKPIAIAGIIGSEDSGVSDDTTNIVIEIATFDPPTIRRGSKTLGLATDASIRFERGLRPVLADIVLKRTLSLINEVIPNARIAGSSLVDEVPQPKPESLKFNIDQISKLIGAKVPPKIIEKILTRLEFKVKLDGKQIVVTPPILRNDIKEVADIVEEVLRIWGIGKVESTMPTIQMLPPTPNKKYLAVNEIKNVLANLGFSETPSHSFIGKEWAEKLGLGLAKELKLKNALHSHWSHLVPALWPSLIRFATQAKQPQLKIFEIGTVFSVGGALPKENTVVSLLISDNKQDPYRQLRGIAEKLFVNIKDLKFSEIPTGDSDKFINLVRIMAGREILGEIAEVGPVLVSNLGLTEGASWMELNLDVWLDKTEFGAFKYKPINKYPISQFDLSIELTEGVSAGPIINELWEQSILINDIEIFDLYNLESGSQSIGLRITMQAEDRTLEGTEIEIMRSKIVNLITTKYRGVIR